MKDGNVVTFDGKHWNVGLADQVLDDIIQQKSDILEEKYDEIVDKLSPMESKKFNNFINRKDEDKINLKLKRELRVQLYNNRHFAKDMKKMLEEQEKELLKNGDVKEAKRLSDIKNMLGVDDDTAKEVIELLNKKKI